MCPVCITTAALMAGMATTTGGLAALVVMKFRARNVPNQIPAQTKTKENHDGQ